MQRWMMACAAATAGTLFGAGAAPAAQYDNTTQGSWVGTYGSDGYVLFNFLSGGDGQYQGAADPVRDLQSLPAYVSSYSYEAGAQQYIWEDGTNDVRALQDPGNPGGNLTRKAATSFDGDNYSVTFDVTQATPIRLGVYALDWDNFNGRNITVTVNGESVNIDNVDDGDAPNDAANDYVNGTWAVFDVNAPAGPLTISVQHNAGGGSNAVLSAVTFDPIPEPASLGLLGVGALGLLARRRR